MKKLARYWMMMTILMLLVTSPAFSQATLTIQQARQKLLQLQKQSIAKGEFETTKEFELRSNKFEIQRESEIDDLLTKTYAGNANLELGTYNADEEYYPANIKLEGLPSSLKLKVPRSEAKQVKEKSKNTKASGQFWIERDARSYPIGSLAVKIGDRTYFTLLSDVRISVTKTVPIQLRGDERTTSATLSPDGVLLAIQGGDLCHVIDISTLSKPTTLYAVRSLRSTTISFSNDSKILITVVSEKQLNFWIAKTGELIRSLNLPHNAGPFSISPASSKLATMLAPKWNPKDLYLWNTNTSQLFQKISLANPIASFCFSPSGDTLAIASQKTIYFYSTDTSYLELKSIQVDHQLGVIRYALNGSFMCNSTSHQVSFIDPLTGIQLTSLKSSSAVGDFDISHDSRMIATSHSPTSLDREINLWDPRLDKPIRQFRTSSFHNLSLALFHPSTEWLLTILGHELQLQRIQYISEDPSLPSFPQKPTNADSEVLAKQLRDLEMQYESKLREYNAKKNLMTDKARGQFENDLTMLKTRIDELRNRQKQ